MNASASRSRCPTVLGLALIFASALAAPSPARGACSPNGLIPGWTGTNIGGSLNGSSLINGNLWVLCSDFAGFSAAGDKLRYLHQEPGHENFEITVRVWDFNGPGVGGLMLRTGLGSSDAFVAIYLQSPYNTPFRVYSAFRPGAGSPTSVNIGPNIPGALPFWLRITRDGGEITTSWSPNGINWVSHFSAPAGGDLESTSISAGLVQSSDGSGVDGSAYFGDVQVTQLSIVEPPGRFVRADANLDGRIDLSDAVAIFSALFLGGETLRCGDAADANDDGAIDISDGIKILGFLFLGDLLPPGTTPGEKQRDPTPDTLGCESGPGSPV